MPNHVKAAATVSAMPSTLPAGAHPPSWVKIGG
jgi:hypothetical protein